MAYTSEIEKLEKRWAENPKGRNFAPLADAYRKAGELDRALELCKAGLDLHPDYVSAHIVYARCLIDQKNDPGASEVFQKVLTLDPENVLALKMLAEMADRGGRYVEEVDWLSRLLNADPMNGEAAEALARAKVKATQSAGKVAAPARRVPETAPPAPSSPDRQRPLPQPEVLIEHESEGPVPPQFHVKGTPSEIETFDGTLDFNSVAHAAARADGIEVQEEVVLKPQDMVVEGLAHSQYESGLSAQPPEAAASEDELPTVELPLIMPDDVDERPPAAGRPTASAPAPSPAAPPPPPPPPPQAPRAHTPPATPAPIPAAVALSDDDGAADTTALSRAEPVLTETMAELYLRQGHQDDALRVYQALLAQRPRDARLRARVESLTRGTAGSRGGGSSSSGETVQAFLKRILTGRLGGGGSTVESSDPVASSPLDRAFAVAPAESEADVGGAVSGPGEATRPATDSISLDNVFGDEGGRGGGGGEAGETRSSPDTMPQPPHTAAPSGGFSFDQFFSPSPPSPPSSASSPNPSSAAPEAPPPTPKPSERASGGRVRPPTVEDEGDLDQFQAWLRGLKS
ncbi:MAG TPA: tetratricopeptide repeat protein [Gemmatimonadales bacterium]|nr:tetratricopeptide repeat protein [Gemmatimonadales bacterium]